MTQTPNNLFQAPDRDTWIRRVGEAVEAGVLDREQEAVCCAVYTLIPPGATSFTADYQMIADRVNELAADGYDRARRVQFWPGLERVG